MGLAFALIGVGGVVYIGLTMWRTWQSRASASMAPAQTQSVDQGFIGDFQNLAGQLFVSLQAGDADKPAGTDATPIKFEIRPGETAAQIGDRLQKEGLIRDATLFRLLLRVQGADTKLETGSYELRRTMTPRQIALALQRGRPSSITVTIPEGWRAEEIAALLASQGLVDQNEFMTLVQSGDGFSYPFLPPRSGSGKINLEGYLFPDTYTFDASSSDARRVLTRLLDNFNTKIGPDVREAAVSSKLGSLQAALTLASIVEREARLAEERPLIAGVYANRLRQGMKLDADPTVQYAMGFDKNRATWWRPLTVEDYRFASAYNTYQNVGLPPAPICNPGMASIQAAVAPTTTDFLFFVARKDGSHIFARTFEDHVRNVNAVR